VTCIIDEIDRVLAEHYGFTDEDLDFIINDDINYRRGATGWPATRRVRAGTSD
jgi:hypothetical protein